MGRTTRGRAPSKAGSLLQPEVRLDACRTESLRRRLDDDRAEGFEEVDSPLAAGEQVNGY